MIYRAAKVTKTTEASKAQREFAAQELRKLSTFLTSAHNALKIGRPGSDEWRAGVLYAYNNAARIARRRARDVMKGRK